MLFAIFQTGRKANGGVESVTQLLENAGGAFDFDVVTNLETPINRRWEAVGATVTVLPLPHDIGAPLREGGLLAPLKRLLAILKTNAYAYRRVKADSIHIVHCNDITAQVHLACGARLAGAKVIFNIRDVFPPAKSYHLKWKFARTFSSHILVLSREMHEQLSRRLPPRFGKTVASDISHIYSVVDMERMKPAQPEEKRQLRGGLGLDDTFTFVYTASVCAKKNQLDFLEQAGSQLKQHAGKLRVVFIGDFDVKTNPYAAKCQKAVERLGLQSVVRFQGFAANVYDWFRAADAVVLASRYEGLARSMIEPLCCGTPVLSLNVCSAREILDGYACGEVVEQGDYDKLVQAMLAWIEEPGRLARYRENALVKVRPLFRAETASRHYQELITRFLSEG